MVVGLMGRQRGWSSADRLSHAAPRQTRSEPGAGRKDEQLCNQGKLAAAICTDHTSPAAPQGQGWLRTPSPAVPSQPPNSQLTIILIITILKMIKLHWQPTGKSIPGQLRVLEPELGVPALSHCDKELQQPRGEP